MTTGAPERRATNDAAVAIESAIARLLSFGTLVAIALVLAGVVGMLLAGTDPVGGSVAAAFDLAAIPGAILAGQPEGFLWAGLVAVMCLPLGRVIVAGIGFFAARDRRLALVSLGVLLVVLASIVAALALQG